MPGLYRSPGLADIDVCFGKRQAGTEALKRTSRRHEDENAALEELMQRSRRAVTLPLAGAYENDEAEDARDIWVEEGSRPAEESRDIEVSDGSMHDGFGDRRPEETGLPPTPPGAMSSDEPQEPQPMFADGVRNALSSQKSGVLSTTPVNPQLSPPTPDTTPPAHSQNRTAVIRRQGAPDVSPIEPVLDERQNLQAPARPNAGFQTESYQTARKNLPVCENEDGGQVVLPENDRLPYHWLNDTQNRLDVTGVEDKVVGSDDQHASNAADEINRTISPTPPRTRYRFESPQVEREETDWEKHISYVSGPDELDLGDASEALPEMQEDKSAALAGLGMSGVEIEEKHRSAEDINNSVYKQIQQENIRRESAILTNSGAIRAGIVLPSAESTPKSVRRRKKCGSLRDGPASEGKRQSDEGTEHVLKHERRHLPTRKALQDSPVLVRKRGQEEPFRSVPNDSRQVSSPARLGADASKIATLTLANKLASTGERDVPPEHAHKLKRQSHGERLSKNMAVRRTSLEVSPSDLEEAFNRIDRGAASVRKQKITLQQRAKVDTIQTTDTRTPPVERQLQMNQGVKRRKSPNLDGPHELVLRKVIPSVSPETEVPASPRQVRRFSREERLENNEQLCRFSASQSQDQQLSLSQSSNLDRQFSAESAARRSSHDRSLLSSPRKSMDARFLHPTTTPMSVSAFSDRTENIEVCEASGVRIYPHNNNSLLVVQQHSRPASKDTKTPDGPTLADIRPNADPIFAAQVDPPTPVLGTSNPSAHVDSPLTNPRAAPQPPEPPSIQFIPPTPNEELEQQLGDGYTGDGTLRGQVNLPGRNLSFKQKVRRNSDSFFSRSTSFRRNNNITRTRGLPPRDTHLSPMWRPQRFWDDYDSEDEYYDDYEPEVDVLPPGGDTSNFDEDERRKRLFFPRAMSKRLPGFRGKGGFLQGNSLGIERHGSNNRRHYVSSGSRTLSKRASDEILQNATNVTQPLPRSLSHDSLHQLARGSHSFKVPFTGGVRAKWVGTQGFRQKIRQVRVEREEREREKRREKLKGRIGMRVYHG